MQALLTLFFPAFVVANVIKDLSANSCPDGASAHDENTIRICKIARFILSPHFLLVLYQHADELRC